MVVREGSLAQRVLDLVTRVPGISDRELTDRLLSTSTHPSQINQTCRMLETRGQITRSPNAVGRIGNYPACAPMPVEAIVQSTQSRANTLSEDEVKAALERWLIANGWMVKIAWGRVPGIDIEATREGVRWLIEAKGCGSLSAMRVNYFLAVIGETLQRMDDPNALYSIAFPDMRQFRGLWERLPALAKARTQITALFVDEHGSVEEK